jgi:hypothetical protein
VESCSLCIAAPRPKMFLACSPDHKSGLQGPSQAAQHYFFVRTSSCVSRWHYYHEGGVRLNCTRSLSTVGSLWSRIVRLVSVTSSSRGPWPSHEVRDGGCVWIAIVVSPEIFLWGRLFHSQQLVESNSLCIAAPRPNMFLACSPDHKSGLQGPSVAAQHYFIVRTSPCV